MVHGPAQADIYPWQLGEDAALHIDWSTPRLLYIATEFTRFETHAARQFNRNINLIRYEGPSQLFLHRLDTRALPSATSERPVSL